MEQYSLADAGVRWPNKESGLGFPCVTPDKLHFCYMLNILTSRELHPHHALFTQTVSVNGAYRLTISCHEQCDNTHILVLRLHMFKLDGRKCVCVSVWCYSPICLSKPDHRGRSSNNAEAYSSADCAQSIERAQNLRRPPVSISPCAFYRTQSARPWTLLPLQHCQNFWPWLPGTNQWRSSFRGSAKQTQISGDWLNGAAGLVVEWRFG